MRIKGGVSLLFREALSSVGFTEIVSPKILSGQSEGGSDVFQTSYFGKVRVRVCICSVIELNSCTRSGAMSEPTK
jgi:aspartyl/asparaginyl-tRNA synthetase